MITIKQEGKHSNWQQLKKWRNPRNTRGGKKKERKKERKKEGGREGGRERKRKEKKILG